MLVFIINSLIKNQTIMKTIKILLLVVAVTFSSVLSASNNPKSEKSIAISEEIGKLLKNPNFTIENDVLATVKVLFNDNNEIVVVSVDCEEKGICSFIKSRLNYKELTDDVNNKNRYYIVPVRVTAKK